MKRLFCLILGLAALLVFTGACSSETDHQPAGSKPLSTEGDVDHIAFGDITMNGCDGANAVISVAFASTGTGTASLKVSYPNDTKIGSPSTLLAEKNVDITSNETSVDLSINANEYKGGKVELSVQAGNYLVKPGEKGFQAAANVTTIEDVSNENCRLTEHEDTEAWLVTFLITLIAIALIVVAFVVIVHFLRKRKVR